MVAATIHFLSNIAARGPYSPSIMAAIVMLLAAIAGVFRYMVSEYGFWVVAAAYLLLVGNTK
jgi:hypothetical protein